MNQSSYTPKLRPCQIEGAKAIYDLKKVILGDDMGFGKCAETIYAKRLIESRLKKDIPALIICPPAVTPHWNGEINKWYKKRDGSEINVNTIKTNTFDEDLNKIIDQTPDFALIGYSTLSSLGKEPEKVKKVIEAGFQYAILDEAHNAKNPEALRSGMAREIIHPMEYLAITSGTIIPNTVIDIYSQLNLLDPHQHPIKTNSSNELLRRFEYQFNKNPSFIKEVIHEKMIRRSSEEYLDGNGGSQKKFPKLISGVINVQLKGEHNEVYQQIYENDSLQANQKLIQLRYASLDPNLVDPSLLSSNLAKKIGSLESDVYTAIDNKLEEKIDNNEKVILFSDLKNGSSGNPVRRSIVETLKERYQKYGTEIISGDVSADNHNGEDSEREEIRKKFQNDDNCKILISTSVMNEGVDLTAATSGIHLTIPYTSSIFNQKNKRFQRIGEKDKEFAYSYIINPKLENGLPTINEGIKQQLDDKEKIIDFLLNCPEMLDKDEWKQITNGNITKNKSMPLYLTSSIKNLRNHFASKTGKGHKAISGWYEKHPKQAEMIASQYRLNWEGSYQGNTSTLYSQLINSLIKNGENLKKKVDIASGPFSLSRTINEPVTNIDINPYMLEAGLEGEKEGMIPKGNTSHSGSFHDLNMLKDNSFDLSVFSLALHYSKLSLGSGKKKIKEREEALREQNRILRQGGYSIITLPYTKISPENIPIFNEGLNHLGFEVMPFSGFYKGMGTKNNFEVYLACLKKVSEPQGDKLDDTLLYWKMDEPDSLKRSKLPKNGKKRSKKSDIDINDNPNPQPITNFKLNGTDKALEELVKESLK